MARKISISFKETTKDLELYQLIMSMEDKSYEVKQILREAFKAEIGQKKISKQEKKEEVNILDF
ncbi:circadian clock-controlled protein [Clostridium ganghwense]|uniref:Circadian clock-controlled protein n=1 Tax=Clostridium ganghwense TaxID=312089 RepID=A0ABT4CTT8_9CLOT|nr:circadian clock-controlled protein [Clostridium ganghwense]MCY6372488.1 circadian clock-controlled protein [Clostridium ganghwense]